MAPGGLAVIAVGMPYQLEQFGVDVCDAGGGPALPAGPTPWSAGTDSLSLGEPPHFGITSGETAAAAVFVTEGDRVTPVAVAIPSGSGWIVLLSTHYPLTNAGIVAPGNLAFVANLLAHNGKGRTPDSIIWFDEYHHGYSEGLGSMLADIVPAGVFAVILLVAAAAFVWYAGSRLGRPLAVQRATSRRQAEYVDALARLYDRGGARHEALGEMVRGLAWEVGRRSGRKGAAPESELVRLAERRWPEGVGELRRAIQRSQPGMSVDEHALVEAGRTLETFRRKVLGDD